MHVLLSSLSIVDLSADRRYLVHTAGDGRWDAVAGVSPPLRQGFQRLLRVARRQVVHAVHGRELDLPWHACTGVAIIMSLNGYEFIELFLFILLTSIATWNPTNIFAFFQFTIANFAER